MIINCKRSNNIRLHLNNTEIEIVKYDKHLGMIISGDLKWTHHIDYVIESCEKKLKLR